MTTKEKVLEIIDTYNRKISNLEWHLINNTKMISEEEKTSIKQRIQDFKDMIWELERLIHS